MEPSSQPSHEQPSPGLPLFERGLVAINSAPRAASEEVKASLAAVRAAREEMILRQRRDTVRLRALTATALITFVVGAFILEHYRKAHRAVAGTVRPAARVQVRAPLPVASAPAAAAAPLETPVAVASLTAANAGDLLAACADAIERRRLRTAATACPAAFAAQAPDAALALKIARVQHRRGRYLDAGVWAQQAIDLETTNPDAFLIQAHAERQAGHPLGAARAYRTYLDLAPRGWHAAEAREALRAVKTDPRR